jgi:hypothetical protein
MESQPESGSKSIPVINESAAERVSSWMSKTREYMFDRSVIAAVHTSQVVALSKQRSKSARQKCNRTFMVRFAKNGAIINPK